VLASAPNLESLGDEGAPLLRSAFHAMEKDPFCEGGYRWRAMSRYDCSRLRTHGELTLLPRVPLYQAPQFNPLQGYGGVVRDYPDLPASIVSSRALALVARAWVRAIPEDLATLSVHMIRTDAPGAPVPEGRHRDGNDWVGIYVVDRHRLDPASGVTTIFDIATGVVVIEGFLQPGTLATFDDRLMLHDTSEVRALPGAEGDAYRSVFVFSNPDHEHYFADAPERSA